MSKATDIARKLLTERNRAVNDAIKAILDSAGLSDYNPSLCALMYHRQPAKNSIAVWYDEKLIGEFDVPSIAKPTNSED